MKRPAFESAFFLALDAAGERPASVKIANSTNSACTFPLAIVNLPTLTGK
jgi:hypothetical protein